MFRNHRSRRFVSIAIIAIVLSSGHASSSELNDNPNETEQLRQPFSISMTRRRPDRPDRRPKNPTEKPAPTTFAPSVSPTNHPSSPPPSHSPTSLPSSPSSSQPPTTASTSSPNTIFQSPKPSTSLPLLLPTANPIDEVTVTLPDFTITMMLPTTASEYIAPHSILQHTKTFLNTHLRFEREFELQLSVTILITHGQRRRRRLAQNDERISELVASFEGSATFLKGNENVPPTHTELHKLVTDALSNVDSFFHSLESSSDEYLRVVQRISVRIDSSAAMTSSAINGRFVNDPSANNGNNEGKKPVLYILIPLVLGILGTWVIVRRANTTKEEVSSSSLRMEELELSSEDAKAIGVIDSLSLADTESDGEKEMDVVVVSSGGGSSPTSVMNGFFKSTAITIARSARGTRSEKEEEEKQCDPNNDNDDDDMDDVSLTPPTTQTKKVVRFDESSFVTRFAELETIREESIREEIIHEETTMTETRDNTVPIDGTNCQSNQTTVSSLYDLTRFDEIISKTRELAQMSTNKQTKEEEYWTTKMDVDMDMKLGLVPI